MLTAILFRSALAGALLGPLWLALGRFAETRLPAAEAGKAPVAEPFFRELMAGADAAATLGGTLLVAGAAALAVACVARHPR